MKKDYSTDHLVYDELGLKEIRCMCCGTLIAARTYTEIDSKTEIGKKVNVMIIVPRPLPNLQIVEVERHDKTKSFAKFCKDCAKGNLDLVEIGKQIEKTWRGDFKHNGMGQGDINKVIKKMNFEIKRRLN